MKCRLPQAELESKQISAVRRGRGARATANGGWVLSEVRKNVLELVVKVV